MLPALEHVVPPPPERVRLSAPDRVPPAAPVNPPPPTPVVQVAAAAAGTTFRDRSPRRVVPLTRSPIRPDAPPPLADQVRQTSSACCARRPRGARRFCICRPARGPSIRVDGDIETLDGAPVLGPNEVESLLLTLMPERDAEALRTGAASEWIGDIADLGRVRCMTFRDMPRPGRRVPPDAAARHLGRAARAVARDSGARARTGRPRARRRPRSSGKRTLISAFVDLINKRRRDHVITIESEISVTHDRVGALISQREVRGGADEMLAEARAALREDPDVLVLENVRTPDLMHLALDAAASGHLVIGGFAASSAGGAIDRIIDLYPPEAQRPVQLSLAHMPARRRGAGAAEEEGGGRVAAREVLLNTPAVRSVLAEGKTSQLPLAIEGGRTHGMAPLNDALVGFVQSGAVDVREAYRHAADRPGSSTLLKRQGLDTVSASRNTRNRSRRLSGLLLHERLQLLEHEREHILFGHVANRRPRQSAARSRRCAGRGRGGCGRGSPAARRTCRATIRCSRRRTCPRRAARCRTA